MNNLSNRLMRGHEGKRLYTPTLSIPFQDPLILINTTFLSADHLGPNPICGLGTRLFRNYVKIKCTPS